MSYTCDKCGNEFEQPKMVESGGEYGGIAHTYPASPCCESDFEETENQENVNDANRLLVEVLIVRFQERLKLFPDEDEMGLHQRGMYDAYLNSLKIITEEGAKHYR